MKGSLLDKLRTREPIDFCRQFSGTWKPPLTSTSSRPRFLLFTVMMQMTAGNTDPTRERSICGFSLNFSLSILSLPKDIRSLFVSALERTVEAKWAASIPNTRPAPALRPGQSHLRLGSPPASFRVLPGTWEFSNEAALGCGHPIAVPGVAGNRNGSASIPGSYRQPSLAGWGREILP